MAVSILRAIWHTTPAMPYKRRLTNYAWPHIASKGCKMSRYELFDRSQIELWSLQRRGHDLTVIKSGRSISR